MIQNSLSRTWFLGHGCKQVPLELTSGKVLWAHPDGYFLNAQGQKVKHTYPPSHREGQKPYTHGIKYPRLRNYGGKDCHILMCITFHGPRPIDAKGHVYECHHLNGNKLDYRPENLIFLSREDHRRFDAALKRGLILTHHDPNEIMLHDMTHHCEV